ncbi:TetR/AcrR family transcriptional regulator [Sphaerimonospora cavernae]|uniref:TetR/AcrR family transcriptional regulator n=1 Tax=Sphaerimonospora cavernae TaxID=1740611 RepID=A0ABV6U1K4_9ACTN
MTRDRAATSERILVAARELFSEHGYDQVTIRMIASAAEANPALVNRYFGSKADLFAKVLISGSTLESEIEGDPEELPARLAAHVARRLSAGSRDPLVRMIDRAGASPEIRALLRARVESAMVDALRARLSGPDVRERALLATMVILGAGPLRRLTDPRTLDAADPDVLSARLERIFTACLNDPPARP